jgi:hypothetical protein
MNDPTIPGATFDPTGAYRYALWRVWDAKRPPLVFVMLNPSTADGWRVDPTIRRCMGFAQSWGYGALTVVNLFAFRATCPRTLRQADDPIGPANDLHLRNAVASAAAVVFAWGNHGCLHERDRAVLTLLLAQKRRAFPALCCLGTTSAGQPRHPLYVRADTVPQPFVLHRLPLCA